MRVLYSHRIQSRDGQSVHVEAMVAALRAAGHEVLVVGPSRYAAAEFGGESRIVPWLRAHLPAAFGELAELAYNLVAYRRLHAAARDFRPELIYERYNLFFLAGLWLARSARVPLYVEVNSPLAAEREKFGGLALARVARWSERAVWRGATRVFAVTGVLARLIASQGVDPARIVVTPNGIEPEDFTSLPPRPEAPMPVVLGFVGFVREWHGLDSVIQAMARDGEAIPVSLAVVGEGPARPALAASAEALGIGGRVAFTGLAAREAIPGLVAGFDIALQPRAVPYASPLKIFEYMAAGRPIVAPDQENIREILKNDETALLFDPDDKEAMWRAIVRLATDAALRRRLGAAAGEEIVRRNYTWAGNAQRVMEWAAHDRGASAPAS